MHYPDTLKTLTYGIILTATLAACSQQTPELAPEPASEPAPIEIEETSAPAIREESRAIVLLRGLPTLADSRHSIAIVELDPESERFGEIISEIDQPEMDEPFHHLYYNPNGRLYATGLDGVCSLAEVGLSRDAAGSPVIEGANCLNTGGQTVGEDIMWVTVNDRDLMFVTFMGGAGEADGGSVGVFDANTNELVKVISARKSQVAEGDPYIMYPHGITAFEDVMVVTSTVHPDLATGVGDSVTVIDLNRMEPVQTIQIKGTEPVGFPSSPVEVLFTRPSIHPDLEPNLMVNTMFGFETYKLGFDQESRTFGEPELIYSGVENGTGVPLEFYGTKDELFISHALPGVVKRYDIAQLPNLVPSGPDINAAAGAHHMIFFTSASGRDLIAVQNNLLNLGDAAANDPTDVDFMAGLNDHSVTVHDLETGELLGTVDFKGTYNRGVENVEALFGSGFVHHH